MIFCNLNSSCPSSQYFPVNSIKKNTPSISYRESVHFNSYLMSLILFLLLIKQFAFLQLYLNSCYLWNRGVIVIQISSLKTYSLWSINKDQLSYNKCTANYFNSPLRDYDENGFVRFNCLRERFNNQFYSILRIF